AFRPQRTGSSDQPARRFFCTVIPLRGKQRHRCDFTDPVVFSRTLTMSSITRFLLNLSIGAKLGIASGLGVLLVATMVIVQIRSNAAMRDLDARMSGQQTIARDAVEAKASISG